MGPPETVLELGSFVHAVEDEMLCSSLMPDKVPHFNAPIYLQNKSQIGKVDEILGPVNEVYFSVKMEPGMVAASFKKGDKVYVSDQKLLPIERFLPRPKIVGGKIESRFKLVFISRPGYSQSVQSEAEEVQEVLLVAGEALPADEASLAEDGEARVEGEEDLEEVHHAVGVALEVVGVEAGGVAVQRRVIDDIVRRPEEDQFIIAATGSGKTLLYELPGILPSATKKTTIVFIPRHSIIEIEAKRLNDCGIYVEKRHTTNSTQADRGQQQSQNERLFKAVNHPELLPNFIIVTTHQLSFPDSNFNKILNGLCEQRLVQRFVFDEIHMLLDNHDILSQLPILRQKYPNVPVTVLSASVSPATVNTLCKALSITNEPKRFLLDRPNLYYQVLPKLSQGEDDKLGIPANPKERSQMAPILHLARNVYPSQAGIVFCRKKSTCVRFAEILKRDGIAAEAYDADASRSAAGREIFRKWKENDPDVRILISTNTLSSGVHKSDGELTDYPAFNPPIYL
ncbi:unnamed protein product [Rhizoctonia solani]|uniref:H/ACA ribonucleoprotein complex subunit GAR1 n=1 Tax=Rhizoctonia solani TaxID=456999 RepID=A0A8H3GVN5_9AGAM|nr:unnamed protein product [Rhizoctonia solani]